MTTKLLRMSLRSLLALTSVICLTAFGSCGTKPTPVASKIQVDAKLLRLCQPLPLLSQSGGDPVVNHFEVAALYHECSNKQAGLLGATAGVVEPAE